jgi:hypothetical protein
MSQAKSEMAKFRQSVMMQDSLVKGVKILFVTWVVFYIAFS